MWSFVKQIWTAIKGDDTIRVEESTMPVNEKWGANWISKVAFASGNGRSSADLNKLLQVESVKRDMKTIQDRTVKPPDRATQTKGG